MLPTPPGIDRGFDGTFFNVGNTLNLYSVNNETHFRQGRPLPFTDHCDEVDLGFSSAVARFVYNKFIRFLMDCLPVKSIYFKRQRFKCDS
jgi:hypothetical protein